IVLNQRLVIGSFETQKQIRQNRYQQRDSTYTAQYIQQLFVEFFILISIFHYFIDSEYRQYRYQEGSDNQNGFHCPKLVVHREIVKKDIRHQWKMAAKRQ